MKSDFLNILKSRGFLHQATDLEGLDALMAKRKITAYVGFDCTAESLHVGSLLPIMMLRHLQKCGHTPIALVGGGTTLVGDPSGKTEVRKLLSEKEIAKYARGIAGNFKPFLKFGKGGARLLNNIDWLKDLSYIDFLRRVAPHFTVNRMLTFESVRLRLEREQPLTFLEFNYMVIQAYDFLELNRREGCVLQLGGSDQWGNIVSGIELARRAAGKELYGLTAPLITTASGEKMGKTHKGAVWLSPKLTSDYDYWQFWRNTADADVGRYLRLFTELPLGEIAKLETLEGEEINHAKKVLANEATALCRGRKAAGKAAKAATKIFTVGLPTEKNKALAVSSLPSFKVPSTKIRAGIANTELVVMSGLCPSKKEAKRKIDQGGIRFNDKKITDPFGIITERDFNQNGYLKISLGKKRHKLAIKS